MEKQQTIEELQAEIERLRASVAQMQELASELIGKEGKAHEDVVEHIRMELEHLRTLVYYDDLTNVLNRRGFFEKFESLFHEALFTKTHAELRHSFVVSGFAVVFIDLDDFKQVNDVFGHAAGDDILKQTSQLFEREVREFDGVARFGGEEFVCALVGANEQQAYKKSTRLLMQLKEHVFKPDHVPITASIGVSALDTADARTLDELVTCADKAMYEAKTVRGKNTVVQFSNLS